MNIRDVEVGMWIRTPQCRYLAEGRERFGYVHGRVIAVGESKHGRRALTIRGPLGDEVKVRLTTDTGIELLSDRSPRQ